MTDQRFVYANFMVDRLKAAIESGEKFTIHLKDAVKPITFEHVTSVQLDAGAIVIGVDDLTTKGVIYARYDQLLRVNFEE